MREFSPSHYIQETTEEFNKHFGENKSYHNIKGTIRYYGIPKLTYDSLKNIGPKRVYEKKHIDWLKENRKTQSLKELLEKFNKEFGLKLKYGAFKALVRDYKIKNEKRSDPHMYSDEEISWILNNYKKYLSYSYFEYKKFKIDLEKEFGLNMTTGKLKHLMRKKLNLCLNFNKKTVSHFAMQERFPIGFEKKIQGEWFVKIKNDYAKKSDQRYNYRKKSHILYEQYHNVEVNDKTHIVIYLDNNFNNFGKENLYLISRKAYKIYFGTKYKNENLETKLNALKVSEIKQLIKEMEEHE